MFGAVVGCAVGVAVAFILGIGTAVITADDEIVQIEKNTLVALNDVSGVSGNFFLGSGQIDSKFYYVFYYQLPDGGYRLRKMEADGVTVYEENRKDGYIVKRGTRRTYFPIKYFWRHLILSPSKPIVIERENQYYEIHVPRGTVKRSIKLDLK